MMATVEDELKLASDVKIIVELEKRGYYVAAEEDDFYRDPSMLNDLHRLRMDYQIIGGDFFKKQLEEFFKKYL